MKVMIDIPKEFEQHFNEAKFIDSLLKLKIDTNYGLEHGLELGIITISGIYEIELLDMLMVAFEKAEVFHSTCKLEGIPVYKMNCDDIWNEAYDKRDGVK